MVREKAAILVIVLLFSFQAQSQVKVRLFTDVNPDYFFFTVQKGSYRLGVYNSHYMTLLPGDIVLVSRYGSKLAVKARGQEGVQVDSLLFSSTTGDDIFSIRTNKGGNISGTYSGELQCLPDFGGILLKNSCDIEQYIAGVVKAEGGSGKPGEFYRTQAVIARTYTYRYFSKHLSDGYNLCDDIHCQVYFGRVDDTVILRAVTDTRDLVITTPDSNLIISAFHSNCGGETSPSEYVWLTSQPYLISVKDPYCLRSKNARWNKTVSLSDWKAMLRKNGLDVLPPKADAYSFSQPVRTQTYSAGSITLPLRNIREYFDLRSAFFSVSGSGDSLFIEGKGYGHGVGLCQEGAMVMASSGKNFREIIAFYYPGTSVMKISSAKKNEDK